jgi:hypothetical protein
LSYAQQPRFSSYTNSNARPVLTWGPPGSFS